MKRVLVIPDLHLPFEHPKALQFCLDVQRKFETDSVVFIGDVADNHSTSRFVPDPDGYGPGHELEATFEKIQKWYEAFPQAKVCIGNHDERFRRKAMDAGLPARTQKNYNEIWGTPGWHWDEQHEIDGVKYIHGTGRSGMTAATRMAIDSRQSIVMGHTHTYAGIQWHTTNKDRIFGLNVGCLFDIATYAAAYGKHFPVRPDLGCGLVFGGTDGRFLPAPIGPGEPYHRDAVGLSYTKRQRSLKV